MSIEIFPVRGLPIISEGDDLPMLIMRSFEGAGNKIQNGDIIVLCHVVVSRSEGNIIDLTSIQPSVVANNFAEFTEKDPRLVEVILRESRAIRRMASGVLVTETMQGFVCANSGVDKSNVPGNDIVSPLPKDPDISAKNIRRRFKELGVEVVAIIADTHGRAHRDGEVNVAVGSSGINVIRDRRGEKDLFGYELKVKRTAIADELAAAAELVIGQANEGIPVAIIRGYNYQESEVSNARQLVRSRDTDLFI
jgi:coenzyme F420-0:L-glutamate ligase/coenzyme F420-1:gamma-L-glutamate ligase